MLRIRPCFSLFPILCISEREGSNEEEGAEGELRRVKRSGKGGGGGEAGGDQKGYF